MKKKLANLNSKKKLLVLGAGGHGQVVAEAAELMNVWERIYFLDDNSESKYIMGYEVVSQIKDYSLFSCHEYDAIVAIGNNTLRKKLIENLKSCGFNIPIIIHPRACISKYAKIGSGTVVLANAVVNTNTQIGEGCIINISTTIDHDCVIKNWTHIASGAIVRSYVNIGDNVLIGAAAYIDSMSNVSDHFLLEARQNFFEEK